VTQPDPRAARRALFDAHDPTVIAEAFAQQAQDAAKARKRDQELIAAALKHPPQGWPEIAAWVDEGTWLRILAEAGDERAALQAIRPPAKQRLTDGAA
jgi:hypothetical protein